MGYKRFDKEDIVVSSDSITSTVWSDNIPTLTTFYTSSTQTSNNTGDYYYNVYQTESSADNSSVQFGLSYGNAQGSGSLFYNILVSGSSPTKTMFGQYRTLILGDENASFIFGDYSGSSIYNIAIERSKYKEKLFPGTMTLNLSQSGGEISLTDDSLVSTSITYKDAGRVYQLVSGAAGTVFTGENASGYAGGASASSGSYGWFLPDIGTIILNGDALDGTEADGGISLGTEKNSNTEDLNQEKIFSAISGGGSFLLNSEETLSSQFAFVRGRNSEFNYSSNPSFISGSTGAVIYNSFIETPQTFITGVGLYNDANELLATVKLSRPLQKDFTSELLLRVKLDF